LIIGGWFLYTAIGEIKKREGNWGKSSVEQLFFDSLFSCRFSICFAHLPQADFRVSTAALFISRENRQLYAISFGNLPKLLSVFPSNNRSHTSSVRFHIVRRF
jgi:hypothetical protein